MNYLKAFLRGFVDGLICVLDPKSWPMLLVGIIVFLSVAIMSFIKSQIIFGILFVLTAINISLNYIWNCHKQTKIISQLGLIISIVALILCAAILCS